MSAYALKEARALAAAYRDSKPTKPLQTIVLGCTHYPLAKDEIDAAFAALRLEPAFRDLIAEKRLFVNPAEATAKELFRELAKARLRLKPNERCILEHGQFYLSVPRIEANGIKLAADGSLDKAYKYSRLPDYLEVEDTKNISLSPALIPVNSAKLVRERLPAVWTILSR